MHMLRLCHSSAAATLACVTASLRKTHCVRALLCVVAAASSTDITDYSEYQCVLAYSQQEVAHTNVAIIMLLQAIKPTA
jgi:hypothetical protein